MLPTVEQGCYGRTSILASLMTFAQRAVAAAITAASSAGKFPTGVAPCAASAAFTSGKLSARTTPEWSLRMIGSGVWAGAIRAYHDIASNPGMSPASGTVGRLGGTALAPLPA